jgi:hypothetical protein
MHDEIVYLRTTRAIRERCGRLFALAEQGKLPELSLRLDRLDDVAARVARVTRAQYPDLAVPVHGRFRHFDVGGIPRLAAMRDRLSHLSPDDRARSLIDLVVTSVLLDAGAGATWVYRETESKRDFSRSEGLAVASLRMFEAGGFSSNGAPMADAEGLSRVDTAAIEKGFQVTAQNPLAGAAGRAALMAKLGGALKATPAIFGTTAPRVGNLLDAVRGRSKNGVVTAHQILDVVLEGLSSIWPGRVSLHGENLGDAWEHPALGATTFERLVPFHKLSQWLTCSLVEPLEEAGLTITDRGALTGLAEYRNGGLFLDGGVIELRDPSMLQHAHSPASPLVVGWRALTVVLLDHVADRVRTLIGKTADEFPLANVLEGGTWAAGREIAAEKREGGGPPLSIESDGTVFLDALTPGPSPPGGEGG